jgi:hypothetical protein
MVAQLQTGMVKLFARGSLGPVKDLWWLIDQIPNGRGLGTYVS